MTVIFRDSETGEERVVKVPCNGRMIPNVEEVDVKNGVIVEVRWTCNKCRALRGAVIGPC
jgi:hypothetical protein